MKYQKLNYKISNEVYQARKIIESCKTIEQVENANKWACLLVDKWYRIINENQFSFRFSLELRHLINCAANDLTVFIRQKKHEISKNKQK